MGSMSSYSAPAYTASDETKIGWAVEARQEAESWMKTQRAARDWDQAIDLIAGDDQTIDEDSPSSGVKVLLTKRIVRELTASMSNIRFASTYRTDNNEWDKNCHVLNIVSTAWYVNTFADRRVKDFQYLRIHRLRFLWLDVSVARTPTDSTPTSTPIARQASWSGRYLQ